MVVVPQTEGALRAQATLSLDDRRNILVVDDNALMLSGLSGKLRRRMKGYTILAAESGKEAVRMLSSEPVVLVLTDLKMPEMNGYELLAYIRENYPHVPVCVMTGENSPEVESRLRSLGVSDCIEKPFEFEDIIERLSEKLPVSSDG